MKTLLLTRAEVRKLLVISELLPVLKEAFKSYSLYRTVSAQRARSTLPCGDQNSAMILFPGLISNIPAYSVKVHAKFPDQQPAIKGTIHLHDLETGSLLAIMDSTYITAVRTGLSGALGTHLLARPEARVVTIVGAGAQGTLQLKSLMALRQINRVFVYDIHYSQSLRFSKQMEEELGIEILPVKSLEEALITAEIIITSTWAREPFIFSGMIQPGTHITTLGPDEPGKCEIDAGLIKQALFVCDDRDLAVHMGAIGGAGLDQNHIHAELGEVISGDKVGRTSSEQITIYGAVGLAFQDLAAAWLVYQKANELKIGRFINFLED
ncbi:ornithine cyclodeaminase family protein [Thermoflavimicrobium dichotomicum]|uniref:Ornithine cyclodeaminase n=1 Tax=Thermoflavimicrobium dichotomicum TaxID=46223 RepID=A0A1I3P8Z1_9BACL|nr:ornithine cyclodeaminase family protein [Thermoflavimicrobium dichotomicum]SFJ18028.1 ornithine cyclodeaminase [Thermoflavimicrobium dichotomicum]